jgi:hypothetical protein
MSAAAPRPVATSRPTPQFERHHDVTPPEISRDAFRQGWLVRTRLWGLLDAGRIDREAFDSALTWRRYAETIAPSPVTSFAPRVDISTGPNDLHMVRRVNAAGWIRACTDALGPLRVKLLEFSVRDDRSWRDIAELLRVSDKTAIARVVEAIEALADHVAGRTVAPPPVLRRL